LGEVLKFQRPSKLLDSLEEESRGYSSPAEARGRTSSSQAVLIISPLKSLSNLFIKPRRN